VNAPYATVQYKGWSANLARAATGSVVTVHSDDPQVKDAAAPLTQVMVRLMALAVKNGDAQVVKAPGALYHVWHLCFCEKCQGAPHDHSQGTWNDHLRRVDSSLVENFPAAQGRGA